MKTGAQAPPNGGGSALRQGGSEAIAVRVGDPALKALSRKLRRPRHGVVVIGVVVLFAFFAATAVIVLHSVGLLGPVGGPPPLVSMTSQPMSPTPPTATRALGASQAPLDLLDPLEPRSGESFITFADFTECLATRLRVDHRNETTLPIAEDEAFFPYLVTPVTFELRELKAFMCNVTVPFKHLMVVQNGNVSSMTVFLDEVQRIFSFTPRLDIRRYPRNRGYAAALNLGMRDVMNFSFDEVPFFFMSNLDIRFAPGLLETSLPAIHARARGGEALLQEFKAEVATEPNEHTPVAFRDVPLRSIDDQHVLVTSPALPDRVRYMSPGARRRVFAKVDGYYYLDGQQQTAIWGLSRLAVETAGFFDENCFPAYHEDTDYLLRLSLLGLRAVYVNRRSIGVYHLVSHMLETESMHATSSSLGDVLVFLRGITEIIRFALPSEYVTAKPFMVNMQGGRRANHAGAHALLPPDSWVLNERRRAAVEEMIQLSMEHFANSDPAVRQLQIPLLIAFVPPRKRDELLSALPPMMNVVSTYRDGPNLRRLSIEL
ncbi:hypothetical protein NESM_000711700 [Novymonas esmeraldas]|uniref:Uncharacterized protein n=1 Tax=Novymonas esmeraldas TaxID=1808958 RepID=A0AAW0EVL7_9TRYP